MTDGARLRHALLSVYGRVANDPAKDDFDFHVGADFAVQVLGYDAEELNALPLCCTSRYAGVGNPLSAGPVPEGAVVMDHACGAGTDLLLALRRAGPTGRAVGVDITPGMRGAARRAAVEAGAAARMRVMNGSFDALPMDSASADLALSNGVLNLAADKPRVLREVLRVLRPGGALYLSDMVLEQPLSAWRRGNAGLWAAGVGGALTERELTALLHAVGFEHVTITARHAPSRDAALARRFRGRIDVSSVTLRAAKPQAEYGFRVPLPATHGKCVAEWGTGTHG